MSDEVALVSDGDGLAVVGPEPAVERFLRSAGLWASSKQLALRRLQPVLALAGDVAQAASELAAHSGRWVKLTAESARLVEAHGLMPSKDPEQAHLLIGAPGRIQSWLQAEQGLGPLLTSPAALSSLGGLMSQAALRQAMGESVEYLIRVDQKVDEVLRKADDAVVSGMAGAGEAIEHALDVRDEIGGVNETLWSTVAQARSAIAATEDYALSQLKAIARQIEHATDGQLSRATSRAEDDVPRWLAVLVRCSQLQDAVDVLELDRALSESPAEVGAYGRGLRKAQERRRALVYAQTAGLLIRMDEAVAAANATMVWHRKRALAVVESANHLATGIDDFHRLLRIEADRRSWEARLLARGPAAGARVIEVARERGPAVGVGLLAAAAAGRKVQGELRP